MGVNVNEATVTPMQNQLRSPLCKSNKKRRLICCGFGSVVVFTMSSTMVVVLLLVGVLPGGQCGTDEDCNVEVLKELNAVDDMLQVSVATPAPSLEEQKLDHTPKKLTQSKLRAFAGLTNIERFMGSERLDPILRERVPGTQGIADVRQYIVSSLEGLQSWDIEQNSFSAWTPHNRQNTEFVNIIATLRNPSPNPESDLKLVLACHYDSKYYPGQGFLGATDSAVPCAMLLDLAHNLKASLDAREYLPYTLQLIFFDGEEAFVRWTSTDSLYGSRHLAQKWAKDPHPSVKRNKVIDGIGLFVLLDLIGAPSPKFTNFFPDNIQSDRMFKHLQNIEHRLQASNELASYSADGPYFISNGYRMLIEDDHKPFLDRGVDVVHVIASPFPNVWHTPRDNKANLNWDTISNLNKIFHVFVAEFLHLRPPE